MSMDWMTCRTLAIFMGSGLFFLRSTLASWMPYWKWKAVVAHHTYLTCATMNRHVGLQMISGTPEEEYNEYDSQILMRPLPSPEHPRRRQSGDPRTDTFGSAYVP